MTTTPTSGAADLPEALRHAADVEHWARGDNGLRGTELRAAAATIRRLHALTAQAISKAPDHVAESRNMVVQAISAEPAGAGYAALRSSMCYIAAFDPDEVEGMSKERLEGRVRSFINVAGSAVASHWQAPAQPTAAGCLQHLTTLQEQAGMYADDFTPQAAQQASAHVLHLVQDAFAEVAMAYPKAFALHKVGLADTAVRKALAAATPQPADSVLEDAARWQMVVLVGNEVMLHPEKRSYAAAVAAYMDAVHRGLDLTGAIDSARKQGGA